MIKNKKRIIGSKKNSLLNFYERQEILKKIVQELNKVDSIEQTKLATTLTKRAN